MCRVCATGELEAEDMAYRESSGQEQENTGRNLDWTGLLKKDAQKMRNCLKNKIRVWHLNLAWYSVLRKSGSGHRAIELQSGLGWRGP